MRRQYQYVAVDVEASGSSPGKYSMLSFGACLIGVNPRITFYRELQPISHEVDIAAMRIGCLGLACLATAEPRGIYDPRAERFAPQEVLHLLAQQGIPPHTAISEFVDWVAATCGTRQPVFVADTAGFDYQFINYYFDNFFGAPNPFGYDAYDTDSLYRGWRGNMNANLRDLGLKAEEGSIAHNAQDDAVLTARLTEKLFDLWTRGETR